MLLRQVRKDRMSEVRVRQDRVRREEVLLEVHLREVLRRQTLLPEVRVLLRQEGLPEGRVRQEVLRQEGLPEGRVRQEAELPEKAVRKTAEVSGIQVDFYPRPERCAAAGFIFP